MQHEPGSAQSRAGQEVAVEGSIWPLTAHLDGRDIGVMMQFGSQETTTTGREEDPR